MAYYGSENISSLKGADPYRERPATVLGTNDERGVLHAIMEVLTNSADEVSEGFGDKVILSVFKDGTVEIQDFGRGVPMDWNEAEKKYAYELIFCTMYASGKFDSTHYKKSAGLNGIGDTAAQFTSEFMSVISIRDEIKSKKLDKNNKEVYEFERVRFEMHFEKGYPVGQLKREVVDNSVSTGTTIKFKPDIKVFKGADSIKIPIGIYLDRLRQKAMISAGVKFVLNYEDKEPITVLFKNGILEYLDSNISKKFTNEFIVATGSGNGRDSDNGEEYKAYYDVIFSFSREYNNIEVYHNQEELSLGGSSLTAFKNAIVKFFNSYGKLTKDSRLVWQDFSDIAVGVISTHCPGYLTSWEHQTKVSINNKFIGDLVFENVYKALDNFALVEKDSCDRVLNEAITNKTAREKAESIKKSVIRELSKSTDNYKSIPSKLVRCTGKNKDENEIYIVEGDSAKGPVVLSRDPKTQAVLASRGKILNCQKSTLDKVLQSEEILNFIRSLGCGIERRAENLEELPKFDIDKLNYSKVIICSDADHDGSHIDVLYLTAIWYLCPSLFKYGKVYLVEAPLYAISTGANKKGTVYAYNKKELEAELDRLANNGVSKSKINIKRMKGLGESNASEMKVSIMDKNNRRLVKIDYPKNEEQFNILIESLMGNNTCARRDIVTAYFDEEFEELEFNSYDTPSGISARELVLGF